MSLDYGYMLNPGGLCQCGCGEKTGISKISRGGYKKGEPFRYVKGHQNRKPLDAYAVDEETGCWIWRPERPTRNYGSFKRDGAYYKVHRYFYERYVGPIPDGFVIDHLCRTPSCVNPAHLEAVTFGENVLRGVSPPARNKRLTECLRGHPYDEENTYVHKGGRQCRECARMRRQKRAELKAAAA